MMCSVDIGPFFPPQNSILCKWVLKQNDHEGMDGGGGWAQCHGHIHSNQLWPGTLSECLLSQVQRPTLNSWYFTIPQGISQPPGDRLITLNLIHHKRGKNPSCLEGTHTLHIELLAMTVILLPAQLSTNSEINSLSIIVAFWTTFLSDKGNDFIENIMQKRLEPMEKINFTIYSSIQMLVI